MAKRDFLAISDFSKGEIGRLIDLAGRMKKGTYRETPLAGKTLAMIFAKSSTRTRVSFEVGAYQLGGQALFLSSKDIQLVSSTSAAADAAECSDPPSKRTLQVQRRCSNGYGAAMAVLEESN